MEWTLENVIKMCTNPDDPYEKRERDAKTLMKQGTRAIEIAETCEDYQRVFGRFKDENKKKKGFSK